MYQGSTLSGPQAEPMSREVLTVEIREGRDLLPADRIGTAELYVMVSLFDSNGHLLTSRRTNVSSGNMNPRWMETFEFHITQWDKEGGFIEISLHDNRDPRAERLGYLRQPLFRLSDMMMEGWYFLDRACHHSASLYFRMALQPYTRTGTGISETLASGISARQLPATAGIGVSGVGSTVPLASRSPAVQQSTALAAPSGIPMGTSPATTPAASVTGPLESHLFILRQRFWGLSNSYDIKDSHGNLCYRLVGNFGDRVLDDIRILDALGNEVGYIREDPSLMNRFYRMPTYLIAAHGTTARLKKKFFSMAQPIFSLRPFNQPSIHIKGDHNHYQYSFYQFDTIIADVSTALAPPGDVGLYGIRIAANVIDPLLLLAAAVAVDRIGDISGLRPLGDVYSESKSTLFSRMKRKPYKSTIVTTTVTPAPAVTVPIAETTKVVTPPAVTAATPLVSPPIAVTTPRDLSSPSSRVYDTGITTSTSMLAPTSGAVLSGIPTTPVVKVTTVTRGGTHSMAEHGVELAASTASMPTSATPLPRTEIATREQLPGAQPMQAERLSAPEMVPSVPLEAQPNLKSGQIQQQFIHEEKEKDRMHQAADLAGSQPVRIPISGPGGFE